MGLHARLFILYAGSMKRDTPIDWPAIKTAYITGDEGFRKLAARFGTSVSAIAAVSKREHWVEQRAEHRNNTTTMAIRKASRAQANKLAKIARASDLLDDVLNQLLDRLASGNLDAISGNGMPGKELESLSRALLNNDELKRRLNGKMMPRDEARINLDREKWEAEQKRLASEQASENKVIVQFVDGDMEDFAK